MLGNSKEGSSYQMDTALPEGIQWISQGFLGSWRGFPMTKVAR